MGTTSAVRQRERGGGAQGEEGCSCSFLHEGALALAEASAADREAALELADFFKLFADPTRVRILTALAGAELCVCDLSSLLGMTQSAVSHQLALLRQGRIVKSRREGKVVWYALDDGHVGGLLALGREHLAEAPRGGLR